MLIYDPNPAKAKISELKFRTKKKKKKCPGTQHREIKMWK